MEGLEESSWYVGHNGLPRARHGRWRELFEAECETNTQYRNLYADPLEISDPEGNYLYNLVRKNMRTLDTIEAYDPQNGDKLLFRVNRKMSSTSYLFLLCIAA